MTKSQLADVIKVYEKEIKLKEKLLPWMFWKKRRYVIVLMSFLGFFVNYSLRVNLSVGIVEMTKNCTSSHDQMAWSHIQSGLQLSAFFMGYIITQCIPGYLSSLTGSHQIIGIGTGVTALLTLLSPIAAKYNFWTFFALRVAEGFMSGGTIPAMLALFSKWAPPLERSRMSSVAYCGIHFGIISTYSLSSVVIPRYGWESLFYLTGCLGVVWYIGWTIVVRPSPEKDRFCSIEEKDYIESKMDTGSKNNDKIPWKAILTSPPVYGCLITTFCDEVGGYILITQYPKFLAEVFSMELESVGLLSALPYLIAGCLLGPIGILADWLRRNTQLTTTRVRKIFNVISNLGKAGLMIATAILIPSKISVVCITFVLGVGAFSLAGNVANPLDIAPQYAGVICGIINTAGTIPGIVFPIVTGYITDGNIEVVSRWAIIFYIAAGIYLCGMTVFCIFGSGELQEWAKHVTESEKPKKQMNISTIEKS